MYQWNRMKSLYIFQVLHNLKCIRTFIYTMKLFWHLRYFWEVLDFLGSGDKWGDIKSMVHTLWKRFWDPGLFLILSLLHSCQERSVVLCPRVPWLSYRELETLKLWDKSLLFLFSCLSWVIWSSHKELINTMYVYMGDRVDIRNIWGKHTLSLYEAESYSCRINSWHKTLENDSL